MMPLTSHSTVDRLRNLGQTLVELQGAPLGIQKSVTLPATARTVRPPASVHLERPVYHHLAQLALAYLTSIKGQPSARNRTRTAREWILTLQTTPTRKEILARHLAKGKGHYQPGSCQANMELGLLRTIFQWGMYHEVWEGGDPTAGIKKWRRPQRTRTGRFEELKALLAHFDAATTQEEIRWRAVFGLMLLTGCRPSEAIRCPLNAITTYGGTGWGCWDKGQTKTGEEQVLPLPKQLMPWIEAWKAIRTTDRPNPYLFPGERFEQPISDGLARLRWRELRTRLNMTGLWNYDIRRTLSTHMSNELHIEDSTIRAILNHNDPNKETSVLGRYRIKSFDSITKPIQAYADWLGTLRKETDHGQA